MTFLEERIFNAVDLVASAVRGGSESRICPVADLPRFRIVGLRYGGNEAVEAENFVSEVV
jgi:hypothetical protein